MKINNAAGDFNLISPAGIAEDLQAGSDMTVEYGVYSSPGVIEYVKMGEYRFADWRDAGGGNIELNGLDTIGYYGPLRALAQYDSWSPAGLPRTYITDVLAYAGVPSALRDVTAFPRLILGLCLDPPLIQSARNCC